MSMMKDVEIKMDIDKDPDNYIDLWKYFSDDGAKVKDKMWTLASFFYTALGVLLGFAAKHICSGDDSIFSFVFEEPALIFIVSILGIILSGYGIFMLHQYGTHIRSSWNRANYIRRQIKGLTEIWFLENQELIAEESESNIDDQRLPKLAKRLMGLMAGFTLIYLILLGLLLSS
jgi:hypothetical protein